MGRCRFLWWLILQSDLFFPNTWRSNCTVEDTMNDCTDKTYSFCFFVLQPTLRRYCRFATCFVLIQALDCEPVWFSKGWPSGHWVYLRLTLIEVEIGVNRGLRFFFTISLSSVCMHIIKWRHDYCMDVCCFSPIFHTPLPDCSHTHASVSPVCALPNADTRLV